MQPGEASPVARTRPRGSSVRAIARVLPVLLLVVLVGCGDDAIEPGLTGPTRAGVFELREVRELVPASSPSFDSLEVTCIDIEGRGASGCLDPAVAAEQEVVLLDREDTAKFRLGPAIITADDVTSAVAIEVDPQSVSGWGIDFKLSAAGTQTFTDATSALVGKQIAIVVDGVVVSAPTVQEPITSGNGQVNNLSEADAKALAARLGGLS